MKHKPAIVITIKNVYGTEKVYPVCEAAKTFANMIDEQPDFELVTRPELNILTYRYCP